MSCAVCSERISADIDGRFCEVCGNPVHNGCAKSPTAPASNDDVLSVAEEASCPRCGGDPRTPIACDVRREVIALRVVAEVASRRATVGLYHYWKQANWVYTIVGLIPLGWGVVFLTDPPSEEYRAMGYPMIVLGLLLIAGSLVFAWRQSAAERRYHREAWGEEEEPRD
jgi:hypothetical protein